MGDEVNSKTSFQHRRGDRGSYQRYLDGMDASMRQKVALLAAHLRAHGRVADMGMGSGTGSYALAGLYPALDVVGVDLDPMMVTLAAERYQLSNLSFCAGDIAKKVFDDESLEAVINSSVLHHVTSFNGYQSIEAAKAIEVQVAALKDNGIIVVRDFLAPEDLDVFLDLPNDDGDGDDALSSSTSRLFEQFSRDFRRLSEEPGFTYEEVVDIASTSPSLPSGWRRFRLGLRIATEFILRKDYRRDYQKEAKEEYTYFTQAQFETQFGKIGLRVLASIPLRNPWIVRNRYRGKVALWTTAGQPLEFPATNYIIAGEKVKASEGVSLREGERRDPLAFLHLEHHRHRVTGRVLDLVRRPNRTLDILPWFEIDGDTFVLARSSYPRPLLRAACREKSSLDGATAAGYVTEPLLVMQSDKPIGTTVEESLLRSAGIRAEQIRSFEEGTTYYPSPGGLEEIVSSTLVEIDPTFVSCPVENHTGFSSAGRVVAIESQQLLRSAQVGGLLDARLELNVYELLLSNQTDIGPWIGETLCVSERQWAIEGAKFADVLARKHRRQFEPALASESSQFLALHCAEFEELNAAGQVLHKRTLEYVVPTALSYNTVAVALLRRDAQGVWIGIDDDDLPAAQSFTGNSELLVTPAWRLPLDIVSFTPAMEWIRDRIKADYGVAAGEPVQLGGRYHPSLGTTPEVVYPVAFEITEIQAAQRSLTWIRLGELIGSRNRIQDGHLRIVAMRSAHALGLLPGNAQSNLG